MITEAVSAGVPVLYCDDRLTVGLSPRTALLTGPDIRSIAQGIRKLCDRDLLDAMSAATADLLPDLSPRSMAERYVEVYDYVIAMKRSARA